MAQAAHSVSCFSSRGNSHAAAALRSKAEFKPKDISRLFDAQSRTGHALLPSNERQHKSGRRLKVRQVDCYAWPKLQDQCRFKNVHIPVTRVYNAGWHLLPGRAQLSPASRDGSLLHADADRNRGLKHVSLRCNAGVEGRSNESASLADVAAKGLGSKPLSLEEQIELEQQMEEAQKAEPQGSIPLSGLGKNQVLSLAEQLELAERESVGSGLDTAPATHPQSSVVSSEVGRSSISEVGHSNSKDENTQGVAEQNQTGPSSLSEVANRGFAGRGLSLSQQVELERLAEEKSNSDEAGANKQSTSIPDARNANGGLGRKTDSGFRRQDRIEAALGQKLQEVLKEHNPFAGSDSSKEQLQGQTPSASVPNSEVRNVEKGGSPQASKRFPLEEVSLLRVVTPEAESALATLRAQVFYTYPDVRRMTAAQRVTARSEFRTKLKENRQEEKAVIDFLRAMKRPDHAVLALCDLSFYQSLLSETASVQRPESSESTSMQARESDPFHDVILRPATLKKTAIVTDALGSFEVDREMAVVGSFALQVGGKLAGQNLVGTKPIDVERQATERGYLYSVAVLPTIRRRGLGQYLVGEAKLLAKQLGLKHLYVHVELLNHGAERLYKETGFVSEQEESEEVANSLKRPRRQILCCDL